MKVLSAAEMERADRATVEAGAAANSYALMERAGARTVQYLLAELARRKDAATRVLVLCGKGNNGGDGLVTARLLLEHGLYVETLLLGRAEDLKIDAAEAWRELAVFVGGAKTGNGDWSRAVSEVADEAELRERIAASDADWIVDAILGTGFTGELRGLARVAVEAVGELRAGGSGKCEGEGKPCVLAVDLPSGWLADSVAAQADGPVMAADAVVSFTAPKNAHVFGELTVSWRDPVVMAEIGTPENLVVSEQKLAWAGGAVEWFQRARALGANKGSFGHVLVVGGARGRSGAAALASLGALKAGAGLVTTAVPTSVQSLVAGAAHELMTVGLAETDEGTISGENGGRLTELLERKTVLVVGPGMGAAANTGWFFEELLRATKVPVVVDADGLNLLAEAERREKGAIACVAKNRTMILTPHPGEMARLTGLTIAEVQESRLKVAREFAARHGVIVALKGARTVIAAPDGAAAVNTSGNPGMAKGGSGDILAGMIGGLVAQRVAGVSDAAERVVATFEAAQAAVWLHGLAADMAVRKGDEHTFVPSDLFAELSQAFRYRAEGVKGYVWMVGQRNLAGN